MPTTRKQQSKARRSVEADMLSDLENRDVMLGSSHIERDLDGSDSPNLHSEASNFEIQQPNSVNTKGNSN